MSSNASELRQDIRCKQYSGYRESGKEGAKQVGVEEFHGGWSGQVVSALSTFPNAGLLAME
jgi:hypothetical protein